MEKKHQLTREKHLNHLVRVVPLLCLAYGIQSYMMMSFAKGGPTGTLVLLLGVSLALSVVALVTYDNHHVVTWDAAGFGLRAPWTFGEKSFTRDDVATVDVIGEPEEFQTVIVQLKNRRRLRFYFVDNGHEFKQVMEAQTQDVKHAA